MKEEFGKFFCKKCNRLTLLETYINDDKTSFNLFRMRDENGIKKWIFKNTIYNYCWYGDRYNKYNNFKECWEETGGFLEEELDTLTQKTYQCYYCNYKPNSFKEFLYEKLIFKSEENNKFNMIEKEINDEKTKTMKLQNELQEEKNKTMKLESELKEEKNKNFLLNEKINLIMNELKEIKAAINVNQNKS